MGTITHRDDDIIVDEALDGDRPRGCCWDESVCFKAPEYYSQHADSGHAHGPAALYCARHYALEFARFCLTHYRVTCEKSVAQHFFHYGAIDA